MESSYKYCKGARIFDHGEVIPNLLVFILEIHFMVGIKIDCSLSNIIFLNKNNRIWLKLERVGNIVLFFPETGTTVQHTRQ